MAKKLNARKPAQAADPKRPATYYVDHQYGRMAAVKHTFNGKVFEQIELDTPKGEEIASLLIESDIFSAVQSTPDGLNIDAGLVMSHLVQKKLVRRFLTVILTRDDGSKCVEADFDGRLAEFMTFAAEVFDCFFTLNPEALKSIGQVLVMVLGTAAGGGKLLAMFLDGRNLSGPRPNGGQTPR